MQPKNDTSLAIGVTDIVKTLLSHPDHGMKPNEVAPLVKDIWRAFQEASQTSSGAIEAATAAPAPAKVEAPVATATEVVATAPAAPTTTPAPAKAKSRSKAREPKAEVVQPEPPAQVETTETTAAVSETPVGETSPKKSSSRKKTAEPVAAVADADTATGEVVTEETVAEEVVAEAPPPTPEELLEAKFGGKVTRNRWDNMDPADSIKHDHIICLIDGLPRKMLHRHLLARYNMTPDEYRAWLHLPADYPMTAPGYSKEKSDYAKVVGLGTSQFTERAKSAGAEAPQPAEDAKATPKTSRRTRKDTKQKGNARQRTTA
ncbi:hypothetical protein G6L37_04075 [Agrobacterium rubi]|nr:hypothetical protein [Agrobacterium rubi]NTF24528.1 hypothetical protein [Agrobacterium rubi]